MLALILISACLACENWLKCLHDLWTFHTYSSSLRWLCNVLLLAVLYTCWRDAQECIVYFPRCLIKDVCYVAETFSSPIFRANFGQNIFHFLFFNHIVLYSITHICPVISSPPTYYLLLALYKSFQTLTKDTRRWQMHCLPEYWNIFSTIQSVSFKPIIKT
jgi:hypothetical protein